MSAKSAAADLAAVFRQKNATNKKSIVAMVNGDVEANLLKRLDSCKNAALPCDASLQRSEMKPRGLAAR
jgi:hypothetical protein